MPGLCALKSCLSHQQRGKLFAPLPDLLATPRRKAAVVNCSKAVPIVDLGLEPRASFAKAVDPTTPNKASEDTETRCEFCVHASPF